MMRSIMRVYNLPTGSFSHKFGLSINLNAYGCMLMWCSRPVGSTFIMVRPTDAGNNCTSEIFHCV